MNLSVIRNNFILTFNLSLPLIPHMPPHKISSRYYEQNCDGDGEVFGIVPYYVPVFAEDVTAVGQEGVPHCCAEDGVEAELAEVHFAYAGGDGDKVADNGHETADENGFRAFFTEPLFGFFKVGDVEQ